ncbi:hypothetical protein JCM10212_000197 [Sporobolomyces blumeae]
MPAPLTYHVESEIEPLASSIESFCKRRGEDVQEWRQLVQEWLEITSAHSSDAPTYYRVGQNVANVLARIERGEQLKEESTGRYNAQLDIQTVLEGTVPASARPPPIDEEPWIPSDLRLIMENGYVMSRNEALGFVAHVVRKYKEVNPHSRDCNAADAWQRDMSLYVPHVSIADQAQMSRLKRNLVVVAERLRNWEKIESPEIRPESFVPYGKDCETAGDRLVAWLGNEHPVHFPPA